MGEEERKKAGKQECKQEDRRGENHVRLAKSDDSQLSYSEQLTTTTSSRERNTETKRERERGYSMACMATETMESDRASLLNWTIHSSHRPPF